MSSISVSRVAAASRAMRAGSALLSVEHAQRFAFGDGRAGQARYRRIGNVKPQPLTLRCRQGRRIGAGNERGKRADDAHGAIFHASDFPGHDCPM